MIHQNIILTEKAIGRHTRRLQKELLNLKHEVTLSESQNIFSRILGMKDFHELKKVLKLESSSLEKETNIEKNNTDYKKFSIYREFNKELCIEIIDFFQKNNFTKILVNPISGIVMIDEEKKKVKINTDINIKNIEFFIHFLKISDGKFPYLVESDSKKVYLLKNDNLIAYMENYDPDCIIDENLNITLYKLKNPIKDLNIYNQEINPLNYKKGLNLIIGKNSNITKKIEYSLCKEIFLKSEDFLSINHIQSNINEDLLDYIGEHQYLKTINKIDQKTIENFNKIPSDLLIIDKLDTNYLEDLVEISNNDVGIIGAVNSLSSLSIFLESISKNLNNYNYFNKLLDSLNLIIIPLNFSYKNKVYDFVFELDFKKIEKRNIIRNYGSSDYIIHQILNVLGEDIKKVVLKILGKKFEDIKTQDEKNEYMKIQNEIQSFF